MQGFISGSFAFAHGIQPSICNISAAGQLATYAEVGTLGIHYGSRSLPLEDSHLMSLSQIVDDTGRRIDLLTIEDRRWRWRHLGRISGYYNVVSTGSQLRPERKKGLRQLIALCLRELKETKLDISKVNNDPDFAPTVEWDYEDPCVALGQLLEFGRLRLCLTANGGVVVYPRGSGNLPSANDRAILASRPLEAPDRPSTIVVAFGRTEYETSLQLEAVALNRKLEWVPLYDVEYMPVQADGRRTWDQSPGPTFSEIKDPYDRDLANRSVWRAYRVKTPFGIASLKRTIENLAEVVPLNTERVQTKDSNGSQIRLPATVQGLFFNGYETPEPTKENEFPVPDDEKWRFARGFTILEKDGVVIFNIPMLQLLKGAPIQNAVPRAGQANAVENNKAGTWIPAHLLLTTSFNVREKDAGGNLKGWMRHEEKFPVKAGSLGGGNRRAYIVTEHWNRRIISKDTIGRDERRRTDLDNEKTLRDFAENVVEGEMTRLAFTEGRMIAYAGFQFILPDGLVAQTTFSVDGQGYATSEVLVHIEDKTNYQPTRAYLAAIKADRESSVLKTKAQQIDNAQKRAL